MIQPDPSDLLKRIGLKTPLIGFYDTPDIVPFEPIIRSPVDKRPCIFAFYRQWLTGKTLHISRDSACCGGAGYWLSGKAGIPRLDFVKFLVDEEGLKASHILMNLWLDYYKPYRQEHDNVMIGPLCKDQYDYLKTVTFYVNPDQMSALMTGTQYHTIPGKDYCICAPFGPGCMQLAPLFDDFINSRAIIGATDIAMRHYLPAEIIAFTVTRPMFKQLCELDENSFLYKPFWNRLKKARTIRSNNAAPLNA
jgi:hypothetical protein